MALNRAEQPTTEQLNDTLHAMNQNTLKAVVFNLLREIMRENWFEWSAMEAQSWIESKIMARGEYSPLQATTIALVVMKQVCRAV